MILPMSILVIALSSGRVLSLYGVVSGWDVLRFTARTLSTGCSATNISDFSKDTRKVVYVQKITKTKLVVR